MAAPREVVVDERSPRDTLCHICSNTDFPGLFERYTGFHERGPTWSVGHVRSHQECPFCRLVLNAFSDNLLFATASDQDLVRWVGRRVLFDDRSKATTCSVVQHEHRHPRPLSRVHFVLQHQIDIDPFQLEEMKHPAAFRSYGLHVLADEVPGTLEKELREHNRGCGRKHQDLINFEMVQDWLRSCETPYRSCREEIILGQSNTEARFIDVDEHRIAIGHLGQRYIALSYVWGKAPQLRLLDSNLDRLMMSGGLDNQPEMGRTIQDAIAVCKALGERYLWVDSLCIIQDNLEDKNKQITCMGEVYSNALVTLVNACSGAVDSNTPLPGVLPGSRHVHQAFETIAGQTYMLSKRQPLQIALQQSKWHSRGWTFQENVLSTRRLFFTESQLYYVCSPTLYRQKALYSTDVYHESRVFVEDTHLETFDLGGTGQCQYVVEKYSTWDYPLQNGDPNSQLEDLLTMLSEYSGRSVTFPGDALNAFQGILDLYSSKVTENDEPLKGAFMGLPVDIFDFAMCWQHDDSIIPQRRPEFPSWSWAGWEGGVTFGLGERFWFRYFLGTAAMPAPSLYTRTLRNSSAHHYENLYQQHGINVAPRATRYINFNPAASRSTVSIQQDDRTLPDLRFRTSHIRQPYHIASSWGRPPRYGHDRWLPLDLPLSLTYRYYDDHRPLVAQIRIHDERILLNTNAQTLDLIVIRASKNCFEPYEKGVGWNYYYAHEGDEDGYTNPGHEIWWLTLMAIAWDEGACPNHDPSLPRRATRLGIVSTVRHDGHRVPFPMSANKWMAMDPKPTEVNVILH